ncbi:MAG: hypothetical protein U5K56_06390 [Halioglobus sp.]|nr:hypothetical protein [Halioglobus sp.]
MDDQGHPVNSARGSSGNNQASDATDAFEAISIVQRGNLKSLENTLRKQWRMGQNIVLCWSADERGLLVIFVPHYFLGNYCASTNERSDDQSRDNEAFVRDLISGERRKTREELFAVSERLDVSPTFIKLKTALSEEPQVGGAVEELIKRYGISYVDSRAVLLFDIVDFSLYTPFEQASQLNSLSYSLNSACSKLMGKGIDINFARTTTGDGYYIWNRDQSPEGNSDLFVFMLLVVADNAVARAASKGNTVPVIRTGYHIGGHYELYQAEGVNPSVFSYIVGDVTIELARMVDLAQAHQVLVGEFHCEQAGWEDSAVKPITSVSATSFVSACDRMLNSVHGIQLSGKPIEAMACHITEIEEPDGQSRPRRFRIVDKHGLSRYAYNLQIAIDLAGEQLSLGLDESQLPSRERARDAEAGNAPERADGAPSTAELIDDLSTLLKKRNRKAITED